MRLVLPLMLLLGVCWADIPGDPILSNIDPKPLQEVPGSYRLPSETVPIRYTITIEPFIDVSGKQNFTFEGKAEIDLITRQETKNITFHAKDLNFIQIKLEYKSDKNEPVNITVEEKNIRKNPEKEWVTIILDKQLEANKNAKLIVTYTGNINDKLQGFYRSSYVDNDNKKRWLATTQFEPVHARRAFPCWDEPAIKAFFKIEIIHDEKYMALSNTPGHVTPDPKKKKKSTKFAETPKMSTYLVAFVISDFKKYNVIDDQFKVWTRLNAIDSAKYAYDIGKELLEELNIWTNISYYSKINKLDQISIPDFAAGAMENWGLVTYRESALLYTEGKSTTKNKQDITTVIAHEFAHQWFGNLLTCHWWNDIWLNEGFATFFQYYSTEQAVNTYYNESWRLMEQFAINNVQVTSFGIDATTKTRPMTADIEQVKTPTQISSLFDSIAYQKAASVIRMMYGFLGDTVFQEGIRQYLRDHEDPTQSIVGVSDLFNSINKVIIKHKDKKLLPPNLSLNEIMKNWVNEAGYPVVTVTKNNKNETVLKQERFFLVKPRQQDKTQWYIPILYMMFSSDVTTIAGIEWMEPEKPKTLTKKENSWILVNVHQEGYYRVNYDKDNWERLTKHLQSNQFMTISAVSRSQLIDDALNLARAGYLDYNIALDVTLYLTQENDYIPWFAAVRAFDHLNTLLQGTQNHALFKNYVAHRIQSFADKVDIENIKPNETHVNKLAKVLALSTACKYGVEKCEKFAEKKFKEWLQEDKQENKIWIDYKKDILCAGLRKADAQTWNNTLEKYNNTVDKDEKRDILAVLGCIANEQIVNTFLESTLQDNAIINVFDALDSICRNNPASISLLLRFINNNIEQILGENDKNANLLLQHLDLLARKVTTANQFTELSLLHASLQVESSEGLNHAIENIAWIKRHQEVVNNWLNPPVSPTTKSPEDKKKGNSANTFVLTSLLVIIPVLLTRF